MFKLIFTVTVKSELTGAIGSKTIELEPNPDGMMGRFYDAVEDCLIQIRGGSENGTGETNSFQS